MERQIPVSYPNRLSGSVSVGSAQPKVARKVVSIPVHFLGSDTRRSSSAIKIQKVFRGFLVRKSMKEIALIRREVDEVEQRILGNLDLIRNDKKERLRVNEMLMGLLFKLDSVRGVGPGVRDCRKAVIKKAIVLQEIIDGADQKIEAGGPCVLGAQHVDDPEVVAEQIVSEATSRNFGADGTIRALETEASGEFDTELDPNDSMNGSRDFDIQGKPDVADEKNLSEEAARNSGDDVADRAVNIEGKTSGDDIECHNQDPEKIDDSKPELKCDKIVDSEVEGDDHCIVKEVVGEGESCDNKVEEHNSFDETSLKAQAEESKATKGEISKDRELMERMMEENAKMMSMMKQLSEQNQAQMQMLTSLGRRVEQLEKAFVCDKSRRKTKDKKKRASNGAISDLDCCPDQKKCGKR